MCEDNLVPRLSFLSTKKRGRGERSWECGWCEGFQSGKTHCAAFCAAQALLAGSDRLQRWKEWRTDDEVREDVVRLIYL